MMHLCAKCGCPTPDGVGGVGSERKEKHTYRYKFLYSVKNHAFTLRCFLICLTPLVLVVTSLFINIVQSIWTDRGD